MININKIGDEIKKAREEKKYTQQYLAQQLGITQKAYSKIENNQTNLTVNHLDKIAQTLETSVNQLLGTEGKVIYNNCNAHNTGDGFVTNKTTSELYERMLLSHTEEVNYLKAQNTALLKTIEAFAGKV